MPSRTPQPAHPSTGPREPRPADDPVDAVHARALIVVESSYGNTAAIAEAVAAGLRSAGVDVVVTSAAEAPPLHAFDLICVGAPTHNMGLPSPASRAQALARRGAAMPATGVAEWLAALPRLDGRRVAAFDTAVPGMFSGSAAKKIDKALRSRRATVAERTSFTVTGNPPALTAGELDRARAWGEALGANG